MTRDQLEFQQLYERRALAAVDRFSRIIQKHIEKSLLYARDPELTNDLYKILEETQELKPERIMHVQPPGPPTISYASPSPKGLDGEVDDPLD